jgi:hypothetical protein
MKIGRKFNVLTVDEYFLFIDNHRKYEDFNTLGLYRSILENELLTLDDKIQVREYAHKHFKKSFEFLQLKDPNVFVGVSTLEQNLTKGDEEKIWNDIRKNQQKILADKRIKYRNFGTYSKHLCPYEDCIWNGIMIRQGSMLAETNIHFLDDKTRWNQKLKSQRQRSARKNGKQIINNELID